MVSEKPVRIPLYVSPQLHELMTQAIEESGQNRQDWLRSVIATALEPQEPAVPAANEVTELQLANALQEVERLNGDMADLRQSKERLELLLAGEQDNTRLLLRALPSGGGRPWWRWRFWDRGSA